MKFTELDFMMGDPGKVPSFGTGPASGSTTQNSFVFNNSSRQIDDASLGYLVEYMELDEFLDECDLRLDTNITETVTELDIDGFLSSKNDHQLPFEVVQTAAPSTNQQNYEVKFNIAAPPPTEINGEVGLEEFTEADLDKLSELLPPLDESTWLQLNAKSHQGFNCQVILNYIF